MKRFLGNICDLINLQVLNSGINILSTYYIADFYSHQARLAIEVDGPVHTRPDR